VKNYKSSVIALQIAALGLGVSFLFVPAGLAIGTVALVLSFNAVLRFNDPTTRGLFRVSGILYAASVFLGSGSWILVAATLVFPILGSPGELTIRKAGFNFMNVYPLTAVLSVGVLLAAWPPTLWWLATATPLVMSIHFARIAIVGRAKYQRQNRESWSVKVGAEAPDFELPIRGEDRSFRLSEARGRHVLIQLARGDWCPVCHVIMRLLKKEAKRLAERDITVVLVSPTGGEETDEFINGLELPYVVLSDPENLVANMFGALDSEAFGGKGAPVPATFIVGPEGKLRHSSEATDVWRFTDPKDVIDLLAPEPA
jgi:peroxiredoxin